MICRRLILAITLVAIGCMGCTSQPQGKIKTITYQVSGGFAGVTAEQWTLTVADADQEGIRRLLQRSHYYWWKETDQDPTFEDLYFISLEVDTEQGSHRVIRHEFSREAKASEIASLAEKVRQWGNRGSSVLRDVIESPTSNPASAGRK